MATGQRSSRSIADSGWALVERLFMVVILLFFIFPIVWAFLTSIKTRVDTFAFPPVWLFEPTYQSYVTVVFERGLDTGFISSLYVASLNTVLVILISAPAAFSMARYDTGGKDLLLYILSIRFLPPIVIIPAMFVQMQMVDLVNTRTVLVIIYLLINIPFGVWLFHAAFRDLPQEVLEAGRMDGASEFETFWYIALPMVKPVIFTVGIISFIFAWNEYLFALIFTTGEATTAPVRIAGLVTGREVFWNEIMAGTILLMIPLSLIIYTSQQRLISGLSFYK